MSTKTIMLINVDTECGRYENLEYVGEDGRVSEYKDLYRNTIRIPTSHINSWELSGQALKIQKKS